MNGISKCHLRCTFDLTDCLSGVIEVEKMIKENYFFICIKIYSFKIMCSSVENVSPAYESWPEFSCGGVFAI